MMNSSMKRQNKNNNNVKKNDEKRVRSKKTKGGFYYSFRTLVLILCLIQVAVSAVINISKVISYKAKIVQITKTRDTAQALNEQLKDNIKNFSNVSGLEAIARNNLKMYGEDEVLVIINTKPKEESIEKEGFTNLIKLKKHD